MKRAVLAVLIAAVAAALPLVVVALARAWAAGEGVPAPPARPLAAVDAEGAAARLARVIQEPTVSRDDGEPDLAAFARLHEVLRALYPRVHESLQREVIGGGSLLFTWPGRDPSLPGVLLMAHSDVVGVDDASAAAWSQPPFGGVIDGGFVWGRGTLDDKGPLVAILEALEQLLQEGYAPTRTLYVSFGHDEEVGGRRGAAEVAAALAARGAQVAWILDEGGAVIDGIIPTLDAVVAMVAVAEKGYLTVDLTVRGEGGHSSSPPRVTAVGRVARAVARLEEHPLPGGLEAGLAPTLAALAPSLPFHQRLIVSNLWLFGPFVEHELSQLERGNALLRTTTAPTMLEGSEKENVLARRARAVVNFRLMPGDSLAGVLEEVGRIIDDPLVEVRAREHANEPSPVSPASGRGWDEIAASVHDAFPEAVIVPGLMVAGTDTKHFLGLTDRVYRFSPHRLAAADIARFHGVDERVAVAHFATTVGFFHRLIVRALAP